jgi:hypothetical protein
MKIYNYDRVTGLYTGGSLADQNPLEPGNWLIPAYATTVEPPAPQDGKVILFVNNAWVYEDVPVQVVAEEPEPPVLTYADYRRIEYPPFTDYLDGVVKGDQTQIDKYIADCLAVKARHPKGAQ